MFTVLQTEAQDLCLPARLHKKGLGMLNPPLDVPVGPKGTTPRVSPSVATSHSGMSLDVQQDQSCVTTETLGGQTEWSHDVETFYRWRACLDTHRWKELNSMWMSLPPTVPYVWQSIQSWSVSFTLPTGLIPPLSDGAVLQQDGLELGGLCQGAHETVRLTEPLGEAFCHVCPAMCSPSSPWGVSPGVSLFCMGVRASFFILPSCPLFRCTAKAQVTGWRFGHSSPEEAENDRQEESDGMVGIHAYMYTHAQIKHSSGWA